MSETLCRVEVFGGLRLIVGEQVISRFRTEKTALLLAFLATHLHQSHPREMLLDLLWPESTAESGRTSLRVALSALRKMFEEHGVLPESVFYTDNFGIGLRASAVVTDLQMMERSLRLARQSTSIADRRQHLAQAVSLYTDLPLKGYYEDWVLQLQQQVSENYFLALDELLKILEAEGQLDVAIEYALHGIAQDPLREEPHLALVRIHLARGYPTEARKAYAEWERLLQEGLESTPSRETLMLAQAIDSAAQQAHQTTEAMCWSALPPAPGRLVGRDREVERLMQLLTTDTEQLLTLVGEGGIGKTRLAIEVGRRFIAQTQQPVWFVDVTDVRDGALLLGRILQALGITSHVGTVEEEATRVLGSAQSLLVLDNFEQMEASGKQKVKSLMEQLPMLCVLVTSRCPLGLPGERVVRVQPLETPFAGSWKANGAPHTEQASLESLRQCPSVQLFMAQAQQVRPGFEWNAQNAASIAEICERLEGVPLALILAASRIRVLSPQQILHSMQQYPELLSAPQSCLPERHRSLRASLEWSYALLSPEMRQPFRMLSVFEGGWDLAAARSVLTGFISTESGRADAALLDILDALIENSLVQMEEVDGEARYRMLETVRLFAQEYLEASDDAADARARHSLFYSYLAEEADRQRTGPMVAQWAFRLAREHGNLLSALENMVQQDGTKTDARPLRMAASLWVYWMMRGVLVEGRQMLHRLLDTYNASGEDEVSRWWAWVAMGAGALAWMQRDLDEADRCLTESLQRFEKQGDRGGQAFAQLWLGNVFYRREVYSQARAAYQQSLALAEEIQDVEAMTYARMWLGNLARKEGDDDTARSLYLSSLALAEEGADWYARGFLHYNLAQLAHCRGEHQVGMEHLRQCLRLRLQIQDYPGVVEALDELSLWLANTAQHAGLGAQLKGASDALRERLHLPVRAEYRQGVEAALRAHLTDSEMQNRIQQGRQTALDDLLPLLESVLEGEASSL